MKFINMEEHFLTAALRQAWNAIGLGAPDLNMAFHFRLDSESPPCAHVARTGRQRPVLRMDGQLRFRKWSGDATARPPSREAPAFG